MSYSFNITAANKAAAKEAVAKKFDEEAVAHQEIHKRDREIVLATVNNAIDLMATDETRDVTVSCSGNLSYRSTEDDLAGVPLTHVSINVATACVNRE